MGQICANRKTTHDFPIPVITMFCSICHCLAAFPMSSYDPHWGGGVRVDIEGRKWYQSKCCPTFLFDFCAHYKSILHRLATYTTRQTHRAKAIGRLCCSIGGLKINLKLVKSYHTLDPEYYPQVDTRLRTMRTRMSCDIAQFYLTPDMREFPS